MPTKQSASLMKCFQPNNSQAKFAISMLRIQTHKSPLTRQKEHGTLFVPCWKVVRSGDRAVWL